MWEREGGVEGVSEWRSGDSSHSTRILAASHSNTIISL